MVEPVDPIGGDQLDGASNGLPRHYFPRAPTSPDESDDLAAVADTLNEAAVTRLVGAVLADMHDEWQASERRYLSEGSMAQLNPTSNTELVAAIKAGD